MPQERSKILVYSLYSIGITCHSICVLPFYLIIIIMVIFMCYFSEEHMAPSIKKNNNNGVNIELGKNNRLIALCMMQINT